MMEKSFAEPAGGENADVLENLKRIRERMASACQSCGRQPEEVTLLAVTKTVAAQRVNAAIQAGVTHIGENRVQEFLDKRGGLQLEGVDVHLIGHLQTNKAGRIANEVDMIESIDSARIARAVDAACRKSGRVLDVLVEVNIGREVAKTGVLPEQLEELLAEIAGLSGIRVRGLMTVPPILETSAQKRQVFSQMRKLFIDIQAKNIDNIHMDILSMGMSSDYTEAILEGATIVRVGSALFGKRG